MEYSRSLLCKINTGLYTNRAETNKEEKRLKRTVTQIRPIYTLSKRPFYKANNKVMTEVGKTDANLNIEPFILVAAILASGFCTHK